MVDQLQPNELKLNQFKSYVTGRAPTTSHDMGFLSVYVPWINCASCHITKCAYKQARSVRTAFRSKRAQVMNAVGVDLTYSNRDKWSAFPLSC